MLNSRTDTNITQSMARTVNAICYVLLLILIVWLPIPLGSRPQWSMQFMEIVSLSILLLWLVSNSLTQSEAPFKSRPLQFILLFMALWLFYQLVQVAPLPESFIRFVSPMTFAVYNPAMSGSETSWSYALTLDRDTSLEETLKYSAYVAMFLLISVLINTRRRLLVLAYTIFIVGFVQSVFGIYAMFADIYLIPKETLDGHRWAIGTFVNRNHYAAHIVMAIGIGLGLLYSHVGPTKSWSNMRNILLNVTDMLLGATGWIFICLVVLFSALFLSQSRGGVISFIVAFLLVMIVTFGVASRKDRGYKLIITTGLILVLSAAWLGVGDLIKRFENFGDDERWEQWRLSSRIIKDYPIFGVGSGNYRWIFPSYRKGTLRMLTYEHAHQDYIELVSEQGLAGSVILGIAFFLIIKVLLKSFRMQKHPLIRGMIYGSLMSMTAFLVHGFVDFNFRIPANAAYFYIIAALGLASATLNKKTEASL